MTSLCPSFNSTFSDSNIKVAALESSLQLSVKNFKELLADIEQLHLETESYKTELKSQRERCESNNCTSSDTLKKIIERKDHIIQLIASTLTTLSETKNFSVIDDILNIICNDVSTQPKVAKEDGASITFTGSMGPKLELRSPVKDESLSEIEGTPTGRTSPIIHTKKFKNSVQKSIDPRDKKKCPDNWSTPEQKLVKLSQGGRRGGGDRLRQGRLNVMMYKQSSFVDLTSSPEFAGGTRSQNDCHVQPLVKKESIENDDTILPSPTSEPSKFILLKSTLKDSPNKFKKPSLCLKAKTEKKTSPEVKNNENRLCANTSDLDMEQSVNLLNWLPCGDPGSQQSPQKNGYNDSTHCDTIASVSLLQQVNALEQAQLNEDKRYSPAKKPLEENINLLNVPTADKEIDSSMSILRFDTKVNVETAVNKPSEPVYKESTVRKKAEKRALKGWSCDECKHFFGELYKDDPVMLAKKIEECSKHRGRRDPARPRTPPNFWNPRWHVPHSTEEFNRLNDAL